MILFRVPFRVSSRFPPPKLSFSHRGFSYKPVCRSLTARVQVQVQAANIFSDTEILPDFLNAVATFACPERNPTCLAKVVIPPPEEQAQLLDAFNAIYQMIPEAQHSIHSAIFQLLMSHNVSTLQDLMSEYAKYTMASENIQKILNTIL